MGWTGILGAFGLSGAAGLNAYVPLLTVATLGRLGVLHLSAPFDVLQNPWVLGALTVLLAVELVVDKVPGADHVNDVVQTFVRPAAGAVLFASQAGLAHGLDPRVGAVLGLLLAFGVHATKAVARPVLNAATLGVSAPVVSLAEDAVAVSTSLLAVLAPVLMLALSAGCLLLAWWIYHRARMRQVAA